MDDVPGYLRADFRVSHRLVAKCIRQEAARTIALTLAPTGADVEATLDAEWASAAAPSAAIEVVSCADTASSGLLIALENLVYGANPPSVISISYLSSETQMGAAENTFVNAVYEQAASEGISIFVCTGDDGAAASDEDAASATHGIGVSGLASTLTTWP